MQRARSGTEMEALFRSHLLSLKHTLHSKPKPTKLKAADYVMDISDEDDSGADSDEGSEESYERSDDFHYGKNLLKQNEVPTDPSQLIDLELVSLLKFGHDL